MTAAGRILEVARFAFMANLRNGLTQGGLALGSILMLAGPTIAAANGLAWSFDAQFGFFGFLIVGLFGMRSGLQEQRELGMVVFFRHNIMAPVEHVLAYMVSLLGSWAALCAIVCGMVFVISGGNFDEAMWRTAGWGLRALLLLGFVPLVERAAPFRLPLLVPALAYFILMLVLMALLPEDDVLALIVVTQQGDTQALARLGLQALVMLIATCTLLLLMTAAEPRLRGWLQQVVLIRR